MALIAVMISGCRAAEPASPQPPVVAMVTPSPSVTVPAPAEAPPIVEGVAPASVAIPAIALDEDLIDLGIAPDGVMEVPTNFAEAGWFTGGGKPGGYGPTVIAGHVDSVTAPAVFYRLAELQPGDVIDVTDVAGVVHQYTVVSVENYPKAEFPTARVFGAVADDELRVITCGGFFDRNAGSYLDNTVVYAVPA